MFLFIWPSALVHICWMCFSSRKNRILIYFSQFFPTIKMAVIEANSKPTIPQNIYSRFTDNILQLHNFTSKENFIITQITKRTICNNILDIYPDAPFGFIAIYRPTSIENYLCTLWVPSKWLLKITSAWFFEISLWQWQC